MSQKYVSGKDWLKSLKLFRESSLAGVEGSCLPLPKAGASRIGGCLRDGRPGRVLWRTPRDPGRRAGSAGGHRVPAGWRNWRPTQAVCGPAGAFSSGSGEPRAAATLGPCAPPWARNAAGWATTRATPPTFSPNPGAVTGWPGGSVPLLISYCSKAATNRRFRAVTPRGVSYSLQNADCICIIRAVKSPMAAPWGATSGK